MVALRSVIGRVALVVGGVVAGLLLLELSLQAASVYVAWTQPRDSRSWLRGGQRIVALGDSNTFGFFLEHPTEEAYPHQVQELWNARADSEPIEVLNFGVPGMNSSKLRAVVPEIVRTLSPDIITVMVGVNDFWIAPVPTADQPHGTSIIDAIAQHSRVVRLAYMLLRARERLPVELALPKLGDAANTEVVLRSGDARIDMTPPPAGTTNKDWRTGLEANIVAMADETARHGVRLVVITYPAEGMLYDQANKSMRNAASRSGAPLIDLGHAFLQRCPSKNCDDLFYFDLHPRQKGHELAARVIVEGLQATANIIATADSAPLTP